ncbi:WD40 repeat domain-containing protein [Streptomyces sp. RerS4]|uniref:WD40 repeat domain-containing protein n=1 Tax=Streptomyces sp. RerS4 TaxID=2942449 RepID=UPI00201C95B6|nr:WD40 repeat domain-containing protein [Streptomyces sp. RerS4]UQX04656.1 WD40 repeat domain-containing protein [Streptomyces sp. RerS4]
MGGNGNGDGDGVADDLREGAWLESGPRGAALIHTLLGSFKRGAVAISPDGRHGLCGGGNEPVRLWELATGTLLRTLGTRGTGESGVAIPGNWVLACGGGKFMRCTVNGAVAWIDTRNPLGRQARLRGPYFDRSQGAMDGRGTVAFSGTGRFALGVCGDFALRIWDLSDGTCTRTLTGHTVIATTVWLSPDARRAVSAGLDGEIRVWDVDSGECAAFPNPGSWVSSVCLSPNGRLVLAVGDHRGSAPSGRTLWGRRRQDRTLWLLDAATGDVVRTFEDVRGRRTRPPGHPDDRSDEVLTARFTSDGRFAVSGEDDGRIRIWNTATGRCVRTLEGHTDDVYGIALTPDDRFLLSGSTDGTLCLWELHR